VKIATTLQYADNPRQAAETVAKWEAAGLDAVRVAEAYGFDSPTANGYLAARTERMLIGAGIVNVYSRTPALIAETAAGLDADSDGRALLGLGASGPQVIEGRHGRSYDKPLGRIRETVELWRRIWRREVIDHHGITDMPLPAEKGGRLGEPLKMLTRPVREEIPLYIASLGPANVAMTAEIEDGWLPHLFVPEKAHAVGAGRWPRARPSGSPPEAPFRPWPARCSRSARTPRSYATPYAPHRPVRRRHGCQGQSLLQRRGSGLR
jgi:F420-dependent oxidoreductase-like protein